MLKFESVTVNFYSSTKTSQVQGSQKDHYVKKLRNIVEKGTKAQYTLIESTSNSGSAEITDPVLNLKPTSDHDDRYEKFEAFIKEQRDFNKKIERHISSNSIEISGCTIELKDLECKCKNQTKEVKLFCENHIQVVKNEIGEEVQKLAKRIANLSSKLSSDLKTLKTKALSTEDSIKHILQQLNEIKNQVCISEQSLVSQLQETSHQDPSPQHSTVIADSNEYTYTIATSNRYENEINEIRINMENCLVNLKHRWPNSTIAISGLTYVPRDNSKNQLIDEINCHYESICTELGVPFIDNKRVTCDNYGNLIEQVFYDDVHLNNKIGTKKLVTNIKYHPGLRGRNLESFPRKRRGFSRVPNGPQREQPYNERRTCMRNPLVP